MSCRDPYRAGFSVSPSPRTPEPQQGFSSPHSPRPAHPAGGAPPAARTHLGTRGGRRAAWEAQAALSALPGACGPGAPSGAPGGRQVEAPVAALTARGRLPGLGLPARSRGPARALPAAAPAPPGNLKRAPTKYRQIDSFETRFNLCHFRVHLKPVALINVRFFSADRGADAVPTSKYIS